MTDARAFSLAIHAAVACPDRSADVFRSLARAASPSHPYTTPHNVLLALAVHTNPVVVPIGAVLGAAAEILDGTLGSVSEGPGADAAAARDRFISDVASQYALDATSPSAVLSSDAGATETADALLVDARIRSGALGFDPGSPLALESLAQAKVLHASQYFPEVSGLVDGFSALNASEPHNKWLNGVFWPYSFYASAYKVPNDICTAAGEFFGLQNHRAQFSFLAAPLSPGSKPMDMLPAPYLCGTVLPLAAYHGDLAPLEDWAKSAHAHASLADFRFWHELLAVVADYTAYDGSRLPRDQLVSLVRHYLCLCLFFGLNPASSDYAHVQAQIQTTLRYLVSQMHVTRGPSGLLFSRAGHVPEFSTFSEFLGSKHALVSAVFDSDLADVLADLESVVSTCCALYPMNDLTIRKYFQLKADSSGNWLQKETLSILSRVETASLDQVVSAIACLKDSFVSDAESAQGIDQVVFERLLQLDLYENALSFLQQNPVSCAVAFPLATGRFWELLETASNLDDRIGNLKLARSCLETMAHVAQTEHQQDQVIRIRHLFKALSNLKNFKLVLVKNQPVTPKHILEKLSVVSSDDKFPPISLIAIILEQNPKSYMAYEKLYKVVNDLVIYLDLGLGEISFPKVQTACVESALIDSNFNFAYKHSKELLDYFVESSRQSELSDIWLMFYQVGKFISAEWFGEYDENVQKEKISVLLRQREILSLAIKNSTPHKESVDHSRLLVGQFSHITAEIHRWHQEAEQHRSGNVRRAVKSTQSQIQDNISGILNEANFSKKQASEKLTNLFTSGLGWAIGADR